MKLKYYFLILFCLWPLFSQANTAIEGLKKKLDKEKILSADFVQIIYDENNKVWQRSRGQLDIERPDKIRWQVMKPSAQTIIVNGDKLSIYTPGLKQVTISKLSINQVPLLSLLSGNSKNLANSFTVSKQTDGSYCLIARKSGGSFKSIQLWFRDDFITRIYLKTNLGKTTEINFSNVILNKELPYNLFKLQIPKGVDIVYQ